MGSSLQKALGRHAVLGGAGFDGDVQRTLMTLIMRVTSYRGAPLSRTLASNFDARGGTIGRAPECNLCLPDQEKLISRSHASIKCRDNQFFILDHGSNPLTINGQHTGDGHEMLLSHGDELALGDYRIAVEIVEPSEPAVIAPAAAKSWDEDSAPTFEAPAETTDRPVANLGYDPFDPDEILPRPGTMPRSQPRAPVGASMRNDTPGYAEPLPKTALTRDSTSASNYDPWRNDFEAPEYAEPYETESSSLAQEDSRGEQLPIDDILPPVANRARTVGPEQKQTAPEPAPIAAIQPAMPESGSGIASTAMPSSDLVLAALLKGLGATTLPVRQDQAVRVAETLGAMLREALEGTMDLLRARAVSKRENRMDQTMISSVEVNPLKFFPNVDEVLITMLTRNTGAYLPPIDAVREAIDDMKAHELATVTGMRVAFADLLKRFDPHLIEQGDQAGVFDTVMPPLRKARMWNRMHIVYRDLVHESEDNFDKVFGASFVRAYADQVRRLRSANKRKR